jgi:hypothetical protein
MRPQSAMARSQPPHRPITSLYRLFLRLALAGDMTELSGRQGRFSCGHRTRWRPWLARADAICARAFGAYAGSVQRPVCGLAQKRRKKS